MPRRQVQLLVEASNTIVSEYLKRELWRLKTIANESLGECPICQEEFNCVKCTLLQSCGHLVCATCWMKLAETRCPVCRK